MKNEADEKTALKPDMTGSPEEVIQTRDLILKIKANCPNLQHLEDLEKWIGTGVWSWPPRLRNVPAEKINRCGDVLNGPIYTCEGYEWPMYEDLPMVPFIQLDLKRCSQVSGVDLGDGLTLRSGQAAPGCNRRWRRSRRRRRM